MKKSGMAVAEMEGIRRPNKPRELCILRQLTSCAGIR